MNKTLRSCIPLLFKNQPISGFIYAFTIFLSSILFTTQSINAQIIGNWTFNSTLTGIPGTYNTASTADFGPSVPMRTFNGSTEYYGENGWPSGALNTSMYLQFSLSPLTGYQLDISTLVFTMRRSNTGSPSGSGPTAWALRSSLDGYASDIATGSITLTYANYTVTPGSAFINLYTTVTFRLYGYNVSIGSGGNSRFVFDNIRANGIGYLLPVRIGAVTATNTIDKARLSYTVYNTSAGDQYLLERSIDGSSYTTISSIREEDNAPEKNYSYSDAISQLGGVDKIFYRLRLRTSNAPDTYSSITTLRITNNNAPVKIYRSNQQLYISGIFAAGGRYQVNLFSIGGQFLQRISFSASNGYNTFAFGINKSSAAGAVVHLTNGAGYSATVYIP